MPLVPVDLRKGKEIAYRTEISRVVCDALVGVVVPRNDRFQVVAALSFGQDWRLQEAHALELPVGVVLWKRCQFRLSRVVLRPNRSPRVRRTNPRRLS